MAGPHALGRTSAELANQRSLPSFSNATAEPAAADTEVTRFELLKAENIRLRRVNHELTAVAIHE